MLVRGTFLSFLLGASTAATAEMACLEADMSPECPGAEASDFTATPERAATGPECDVAYCNSTDETLKVFSPSLLGLDTGTDTGGFQIDAASVTIMDFGN